MKPVSILLVVSLAATSIYGCAPVVVGGAVAGGSALHDRRSVGTFVDDQGIEMKARLAIHDNRELSEQVHVSVTSFNGVVLLTGQAPTETLRQQVQDIVAGVENVRLVHNEISIAAPNSMMTRSSDTLITAKVKTALFNIKGIEDFDPTRVKVVTEDGVVYLMGLVHRREADAVTDQARQVSGAMKIVKVFEYLD
jgi:osmotically-inducible protein OsmY